MDPIPIAVVNQFSCFNNVITLKYVVVQLDSNNGKCIYIYLIRALEYQPRLQQNAWATDICEP
ncbi:hypothetical protein ACJIZ3_021041 [Penstemon smallii]|uniref:Uncharacterized protein n=1 Tax=Penstemon smallii TaxID=265156 RepID=A0ABD3SKJ5_9LAMI